MRAWVVGIVLWALVVAPAASATAATTGALAFTDVTRAAGPAEGLLVVSEGALAWDATAALALVERHFTNYTSVDNPGNSSSDLYAIYGRPVDESRAFGRATLLGGEANAGGALLIRALDGALEADATALPRLGVAPVVDPVLAQERPDVGNGDDVVYEVSETFAGAFLSMASPAGRYVLTGSFVIEIFGPDYTLVPEGGSGVAYRTGVYETGRIGPSAQARVENQRITLHDAVLTLRADGPVTLLAHEATVDFGGGVEATDVDGVLPLPGVGASTRWSGASSLTLTPLDGRVALMAAAAPAPVAEAASGAAAPWIAAIGFPLVAAAVAVAWLVRRRRQEDDLALALLAMEERRYEDALPRLARALQKRPRDTDLLLDQAHCLEEIGQLQAARASYESALREAPAHAEAHYYYARVLARLHLRGPSLAHLAEALQLDPRLEELAHREGAFRGIHDGSLGVSR